MATAAKPNIIMIMADDVGIWNVSAYHRGMMGAARRTLTDSPARARCSRTTTDSNPAPPDARRSSRDRRRFAPVCSKSACPRQNRACRILIRRSPRSSSRLATRRPRSARTTWGIATSTCPPSTASTSSTGSSTTSMHWKSPTIRIPEGREVPREIRPPQHHPKCRDRRRRPDGGSTLGPRRQADDHRCRPAAAASRDGPRRQGEHGRHRRGSGEALARLHRPFGEGEAAVFPLAQLHALPLLYASVQDMGRQDRLRTVCRCDGRAGLGRGRIARQGGRAGHRRQHDRDVYQRQRRGNLQLARWRQPSVPRRERHGVRRRLPRTPCWSSGPASSSRAPSSTRSCRRRTGCRRSSRPRASRT